MKKIYLLFILCFAVILIAACQSENSEKQQPTEAQRYESNTVSDAKKAAAKQNAQAKWKSFSSDAILNADTKALTADYYIVSGDFVFFVVDGEFDPTPYMKDTTSPENNSENYNNENANRLDA